MKIICEKDKLLKGINSVVKGVASKTTMPILEGILIQTNDNSIKLTTYDKEIGIEYFMDCEIVENGSTVVNAMVFSELIRRLPNTDIKITLNDNDLLVIECEGSIFKLATMNPLEFPDLPQIDIDYSISVEQKALRNMIKKTIFAVSSDENRPIFTGCLFDINDNKLNIVAVDGFRMAWKCMHLPQASADFLAIIPSRTLNEVNKILQDSFDPVRIGVADNQAVFEMPDCKLVTRLLDGEFLKYNSAIPNGFETKICVNKNSLLDCFERASLIASSTTEKERKYPVKMSIDIGKLTISCTNQTGDAKEEIFLSTEGKNLDIGFNPKYMIDALKAIDDEEIVMEFGTTISPAIIRSIDDDGDFIYMILPIRLV